MRPSFQLDPTLLSPSSSLDGTERHTLPGLAPESPPPSHRSRALDGLADEFFAAGEDGRFEQEQEPAEDDLELEQRPVTLVVRTPEMDARRARFTRVVAGAVGCFAALLAFGVVLNAARAESAPREAEPSVAAALQAQPRAGAVRDANATLAEASAPARVPVAETVDVPLRPSAAPRVVAPSGATSTPRVAPSPDSARSERGMAQRTAPEARSLPVAQSPRPASTLPSVANFAARAGDAPKHASQPPTASFAPVQ